MDLRLTDEELRSMHDNLQAELRKETPVFDAWLAVRELLELRRSTKPDSTGLLSERVRKVREKENIVHLRKQANSELKNKCLQGSVEIYLSTGNEAMTPSSLVEMLAESGIISRQEPHWKVAALGRVHQWLKWDKQKFAEVDQVRKLWALRPDYYEALKAKAA